KSERTDSSHIDLPDQLAVNLLGYAKGEFGRAEDVRTTARALAKNGVPFSVVDIAPASFHGQADESISHWITNDYVHPINIFHINADATPPFLFKYGAELFDRKINIGYWAWELPHCPSQWDLSFRLVHEVWAPSRFTRDAIAERSTVPVVHMP